MKKNNSVKMIIIDILILIIAVLADQFVKIAVTCLKGKSSKVLINGVLEFYYHENKGAAFGILNGQRVFFILMAVVVLLVILYFIMKLPAEKKYIKLNIALTFVLAGAIGNTIDRISLGYVRDFIYFSIIDFPIFNVADMYITVSTFLIIIMILFCYKEADLEFLGNKK